MKSNIFSNKAPSPIGPYSQAIEANGFVFVSGQIPINMETGKLETEDIKKATHLVMNHLGEILGAAGSGWDKVVKVSIFLKDMSHFPQVNEVYASYFEGLVPPARETVEVSRLPKDVPVEISLIAVK